MKYMCDCGEIYNDPDAIIMCADLGHGKRNKKETAKNIRELISKLNCLAKRQEEILNEISRICDKLD